MTLHYGGKYNGDEKSLPQKEHHQNAVAFIEAASTKELSLICNCGCILLMIILAVPFVLLGKEYFHGNRIYMILAAICGVLSLFPHELLHAICYKEDVYLYNNLRQGLFFVIGTEAMSKSRFVFMCLCPNIFLGLIPYSVFLFIPRAVFLGLFGLICIGMGFGDYINTYNAIRQMPKGAKTYLSGLHSYWYLG